MVRRLYVTAVLAAFLGAGTSARAVVDPQAVCAAAKAQAAGKKAASLLKAFGKNAKNESALRLDRDVSKASSKFTKAFDKAEARGGCLTNGDAAGTEARIDLTVCEIVDSVGIPACGNDCAALGEECDGTDSAACPTGVCLNDCTCGFALTMAIGEGSGTTVPATGTHKYAVDEEVIVSASPDSGWIFSYWTGDVDDPASPTTTVTIDSDKDVAAYFSAFPWSYRRSIEIPYSGAAPLTDYEVKLQLDTPTLLAGDHMQADGADLRFLSDVGVLIPYWTESWNPAGQSIVWVRVPSITNGLTQIYMYYGNPSATSASDGKDTMAFFDDFNINASNRTQFLTAYDGSGDSEAWELDINQPTNLPTISVSQSIVRVQSRNFLAFESIIASSFSIGDFRMTQGIADLSQYGAAGMLDEGIFGADTDGLIMWYRISQGEEMGKYVASIQTWFDLTPMAIPTGAWRLEITQHGDLYNAWFDNTRVITDEPATTGSDQIGFRPFVGALHTNNYIRVDYVAVGQYSADVGAATIGSETPAP